MPFNVSGLVSYIDKKAKAIDDTISEKNAYLKSIQDELDQYDLLLRRQNALSAAAQRIKDRKDNLNDDIKSRVHSVIRSLIFDIDSENVTAKKNYALQRKDKIDEKIAFLKKRKKEILDIKALYVSP